MWETERHRERESVPVGGRRFNIGENEASIHSRLEPAGVLRLNSFKLFCFVLLCFLQVRNLRPREYKWLPQICMVSQCQNPDEDLTLKSCYKDNINKASDLTQNMNHSKHSVNMNFPFSFPLCQLASHQDSPSIHPHLKGKYQWIQGHRDFWKLTKFPRIH